MCAQVEIDEVNRYIIFNKTHLFEEKYKDHNKNAKKYQSALDKIEKDNVREKKGKDRRYKVCYNHYKINKNPNTFCNMRSHMELHLEFFFLLLPKYYFWLGKSNIL